MFYKTGILSVFYTIFRYILYYAFLPEMVLPLYYISSRASILTRSYHYMRTKIPCTEITSRNVKNTTLDPYNFFWLGSFMSNLTKILIYNMYITPCRSLLLFGAGY